MVTVDGVCVYASNVIYSKRLADLENADHECMWIWLRPNRLPRPLSGLAVCVVHNPPGRNTQAQRVLRQYLISSIDLLRNKYPDCAIIVLGDFNNFNIEDITFRQNLTQVVSKPTRTVLDMIATDIHRFYEKPQIFAPLGSHDHNIVMRLLRSDSNSRITITTNMKSGLSTVILL